MAIKQEKMTLDRLAVMIKNGFDSVDRKFEEARMENAKEHEKMILRLDNVAYRFELVELQRRVEKLEKTANIKK